MWRRPSLSSLRTSALVISAPQRRPRSFIPCHRGAMAAYCARRPRPILLCIVANVRTDLSLTGDDNGSGDF